MASAAAADRTVSPTELRHSFSLAVSKIYQDEVPLYSDLLRLVSSVNATVLSSQPLVSEKMQATNQLDRLSYKRHGAIRLGMAEELALMARFFALMGMVPVRYYDLAQPPANLPIHATCFRCLDLESLLLSPFRIADLVAGSPEHRIPMKELIEGPPARKCNILLRQTSFQVLEEKVYFSTVHTAKGDTTDRVLGSHTARFGEIEQRGAALTVKGRQLFDSCVTRAWMQNVTAADTQAYGQIFSPIPDFWEELRTQKLAYFRYYPAVGTMKSASDGGRSIEELVEEGKVAYEPLTYEDFLPLSAAGIFQSSLKRKGSSGSDDSTSAVDDSGRDTADGPREDNYRRIRHI